MKIMKFTVWQQARGSLPDGHSSPSWCWSQRDSPQRDYQTCAGHMVGLLIWQQFLRRDVDSNNIQPPQIQQFVSRLELICHPSSIVTLTKKVNVTWAGQQNTQQRSQQHLFKNIIKCIPELSQIFKSTVHEGYNPPCICMALFPLLFHS